MATTHSLERADGSPITGEEWIAVLSVVEGVRLVRGSNGEAEVFHPKFTDWVPGLRWIKPGRIVCTFEDADGPVAKAAHALAKELGAQITDGE